MGMLLLYLLGGLAFVVTGIMLCFVAAYFLVWQKMDFPLDSGEDVELDDLISGMADR